MDSWYYVLPFATVIEIWNGFIQPAQYIARKYANDTFFWVFVREPFFLLRNPINNELAVDFGQIEAHNSHNNETTENYFVHNFFYFRLS